MLDFAGGSDQCSDAFVGRTTSSPHHDRFMSPCLAFHTWSKKMHVSHVMLYFEDRVPSPDDKSTMFCQPEG